jgi:hypothetical protein
MEEFQNENLRTANEFWHRHVKSLRGRRAVWRSIGAEEPKAFVEWRKEEETVLSVSAHPSYVASIMSVIVPHEADTEETLLPPAYLGRATNASIRTLQYSMFNTSMLALLARFPFGVKDRYAPLVAFDETDYFHKRLHAGRHVLHGIIEFLFGEGRDSPYFKPAMPPWVSQLK